MLEKLLFSCLCLSIKVGDFTIGEVELFAARIFRLISRTISIVRQLHTPQMFLDANWMQ
jgi:hypothetical protein